MKHALYDILRMLVFLTCLIFVFIYAAQRGPVQVQVMLAFLGIVFQIDAVGTMLDRVMKSSRIMVVPVDPKTGAPLVPDPPVDVTKEASRLFVAENRLAHVEQAVGIQTGSSRLGADDLDRWGQVREQVDKAVAKAKLAESIISGEK